MNDSTANCDLILRAAYQISGLIGGKIMFAQLIDAVSLPAEQLQEICLIAAEQGLIVYDGDQNQITLTTAGVTRAANLEPVYEPPMFQDI